MEQNACLPALPLTDVGEGPGEGGFRLQGVDLRGDADPLFSSRALVCFVAPGSVRCGRSSASWAGVEAAEVTAGGLGGG